MKGYTNHGQYKVWLKGSRRTITRSIYEKDGRWFIIWGGQTVEVKRGTNNFYTVEAY